jgi:hypothetical protein
LTSQRHPQPDARVAAVRAATDVPAIVTAAVTRKLLARPSQSEQEEWVRNG